jgi:hypothetical protein
MICGCNTADHPCRRRARRPGRSQAKRLAGPRCTQGPPAAAVGGRGCGHRRKEPRSAFAEITQAAPDHRHDCSASVTTSRRNGRHWRFPWFANHPCVSINEHTFRTSQHMRCPSPVLGECIHPRRARYFARSLCTIRAGYLRDMAASRQVVDFDPPSPRLHAIAARSSPGVSPPSNASTLAIDPTLK